MSKKILIAPNSFKEVADSKEVTELIQKYLMKQNSSFNCIKAPISDGGDGFLEVCQSVFNLEKIKYEISTPYDESSFECEIGYSGKLKNVYIESATVLGLKVIPEEKRDPLYVTSKGLGDLLLKIADDINKNKLAVERIYIGVGGTGTNDLGLGMCSRFGLELIDIYGKPISAVPEYFPRVKEVIWSEPDLPFEIIVISDVNNPLLGAKGATKTFGLQKGADKGEIRVLELGFNKIIKSLNSNDLQISIDELSGAGGGLAAGFQIFFNSKIIKAKEFILDTLKLREQVDNSDYIITGEGSFDSQTLQGKGAGIISNYALDQNKKVILFCGKIDEEVKNQLSENVIAVELSSFFDNIEESINNFEEGTQKACEKITSLI